MTTDLLNRTLSDRYRLKRVLGKGGMATVYAAEDLNFQAKIVAVKVLNQDLCRDAAQREKFRAEANLVSQLNNPHIVNVTDYGVTDDNIPFLVMRELKGKDLHVVLHELGGPMPWTRAVKIAIQVCDALASAHEAGVVHRDIKPSNCFLETNRAHGTDFVKVLDLGIAKVTDEARRSQLKMATTAQGAGALGTWEYISPEQAQGEKVDFRADFYSLGVMLYRMITGVLPFVAAEDAPARAILYKHVSEEPRPPRSVNPSIPKDLEHIVLTAMSKSPDERGNSAVAMMKALQRTLDDHGSTAGGDPPRPSMAQRLFYATTVIGGFSLTTAALMLFTIIGIKPVAKARPNPPVITEQESPTEIQTDPPADHPVKPPPEPPPVITPPVLPDAPEEETSPDPITIPDPPLDPPRPKVNPERAVQRYVKRSKRFDECRGQVLFGKVSFAIDISFLENGKVNAVKVHKIKQERLRKCIVEGLKKFKLPSSDADLVLKQIEAEF